MTAVIKCPHCGGPLSVWRGYRKVGWGSRHLKLCKKCRRKFTPDDGFLRARFNPRIIKEAVRLYRGGMSSSEVQSRLRNREGIDVSRWTIIQWFKKYSG